MHGYLTIDDLRESNVIEYKGETLLLLESNGEITTYIDDDNEFEDPSKVDPSSIVMIRQRWKVDVLPPDKFSKTFTTHRYITAYYCSYGELIKEQEKIYISWEVHPSGNPDGNELGDNFDNLF